MLPCKLPQNFITDIKILCIIGFKNCTFKSLIAWAHITFSVIMLLYVSASELFMVWNVYLGFFNKHSCTYWWIKKSSTHCKHFSCNTLTHSTNEDLLNIKRKGDPKSRTLSRTSDTNEILNPCVIQVILLACFTYIDIFKFINSLDILTRIFVSTRKLTFEIS